MKKTLIAAAVMAASGVAFAASNVTLYGVIEEGVVVSTSATDTALVSSLNKVLQPTMAMKALKGKRLIVNPSFTLTAVLAL